MPRTGLAVPLAVVAAVGWSLALAFLAFETDGWPRLMLLALIPVLGGLTGALSSGGRRATLLCVLVSAVASAIVAGVRMISIDTDVTAEAAFFEGVLIALGASLIGCVFLIALLKAIAAGRSPSRR